MTASSLQFISNRPQLGQQPFYPSLPGAAAGQPGAPGNPAAAGVPASQATGFLPQQVVYHLAAAANQFNPAGAGPYAMPPPRMQQQPHQPPQPQQQNRPQPTQTPPVQPVS